MPPTEIYTLSLHDALPISLAQQTEALRQDRAAPDPPGERAAARQGVVLRDLELPTVELVQGIREHVARRVDEGHLHYAPRRGIEHRVHSRAPAGDRHRPERPRVGE